MKPMKAVFGLWSEIEIGQLNRLLKPFGCKLDKTTSKKWAPGQVSITATGTGLNPTNNVALDLAGALRQAVRCIEEEVSAAAADEHPVIQAHAAVAAHGREILAKWGIIPAPLASTATPESPSTEAGAKIPCEHDWSNGSDYAVCTKCEAPKHAALHR